MLDTPQIIATDEQLTAVIHITVPRAEIRQVMEPAIAEVVAALAAHNIAPAGPCFSYHLRKPSDTFDFEVGFPVATPVPPGGRVKMSNLPAAKVARTVYRGAYEGLADAWAQFLAGLKPRASAHRTVYGSAIRQAQRQAMTPPRGAPSSIVR